jgi:hypothetical protein
MIAAPESETARGLRAIAEGWPLPSGHDRQAAARSLLTVDPFGRLSALGFADRDARTLADHFLDAESARKVGHGMPASTGSRRLTG